MEAILWKLRTGAIFLKNFALGKQHITALIVGHLKVCGIIFLKLRGVLGQEWVFIDGSDFWNAIRYAIPANQGSVQKQFLMNLI
jgi:hypothetical protein